MCHNLNQTDKHVIKKYKHDRDIGRQNKNGQTSQLSQGTDVLFFVCISKYASSIKNSPELWFRR